MAYNKRISETTLPANYVDGQELPHVDYNKLINTLREGINANYVDIQKIREAAVGSLIAAPLEPIAGAIYFNTTDNHFYGYNGTIWKQLDN